MNDRFFDLVRDNGLIAQALWSSTYQSSAILPLLQRPDFHDAEPNSAGRTRKQALSWVSFTLRQARSWAHHGS